MADSTGRRPVVVGVDRSGHSEKALDWAVSEASARSLPLHLVHALETTVTVWSPMMAVPQDLDDHSWVLDAARRRVGETAPDLDVTSALTAGPAAAALVTASRDADTVVVGAGGHGVVGNILLGSTSLKVAGHASCPVVVVRGSAAASSAHRTVVVGFDGSDLSVDALGLCLCRSRAARPAARRGDVLGAGAVDVPQPGRRRGDSRGGGGSPEGDRRLGRLPVAREEPLCGGPYPRHDRPRC